MVIVFEAHAAVTPDGNPVAVPIPVAPVVVCVILVKAVLMQSVGVEEAEATLIGEVQRLSTKNIAPLLSDADKVTVPLPVAPAVVLIAQAAPTAASSPLLVILSYNSVSEAGLVAAQPEKVRSLFTKESISTAALADNVVTPDAVEVPALVTLSVPGSRSKGPPEVPSALTPPVTSTPLNATIEPIIISALALVENVKSAPSVPSATLYKTVPLNKLSPLFVP